jgi:hypothetical protein
VPAHSVSIGGLHGPSAEPSFTADADDNVNLAKLTSMNDDKPATRNWPLIIAVDIIAGIAIVLLIAYFGG